MRLISTIVILAGWVAASTPISQTQTPLLHHASTGRNVSAALFAELEEFARIVDITYCVGLTPIGISKPFNCVSRCSDFPAFELVRTWNTGPLLSDSCGYIALDHGKQRLIVAFRGTYSMANTVVDLSTVPQKYVPYPGEGGEGDDADGAINVRRDTMASVGGVLEKRVSSNKAEASKCEDCTVHMGFYRAWQLTRSEILKDLNQQLFFHPGYDLHLVGHSLGGAVAALAALDLQTQGWDPTVTTFGEPRIGNANLTHYLDMRFNLAERELLDADDVTVSERLLYRRVTHIDDPVPLLPLTEWGYAMHAGEIYISKADLSPDVQDLQRCHGDNDQHCIAAQDSTTSADRLDDESTAKLRKRDLLVSVQDEVHDVVNEPWGIPSRYKLWQLFFAHRDYFWRLGLCIPGGDPLGGGGKYGQDEPKAEL